MVIEPKSSGIATPPDQPRRLNLRLRQHGRGMGTKQRLDLDRQGEVDIPMTLCHALAEEIDQHHRHVVAIEIDPQAEPRAGLICNNLPAARAPGAGARSPGSGHPRPIA
jgi:hypothetical protein